MPIVTEFQPQRPKPRVWGRAAMVLALLVVLVAIVIPVIRTIKIPVGDRVLYIWAGRGNFVLNDLAPRQGFNYRKQVSANRRGFIECWSLRIGSWHYRAEVWWANGQW